MTYRKKGKLDSKQQETYDKIHEKLIEILQNDGFYEERGKSELARKTGADRRTIDKHLRRIPPNAFIRMSNGKKYLKRDVSVVPELDWAYKKGKAAYAYLNIPKGKEIGVFRCDSDENPQKLMSIFSWLQDFFFNIDPFLLRQTFNYALHEKKMNESYFNGEKDITKISDEELEKAWYDLFGNSKRAMITFSINPQELLAWIKGEGKADLRRALPNEVCKELYHEASELWQQRQEWKRRLGKLEK